MARGNPRLLRVCLLASLISLTPALAATRAASGTSPASTSAAVESRPHGGRDALREAIWQLERSLRERLRTTEGGLASTVRAHGNAALQEDDVLERLAVMRRDGKKLGADGAEL